LCCGCSVNTIRLDVNKYVTPIANGYDGYGEAFFEIDYNKIITMSQASDENKLKAAEILEAFDLFVAKHEQNGLKNGSEISVTWEPNQDVLKAIQNLLNIKFKYDNYMYTVSGLQDVQEYDPFVDMFVNTERSSSGKGILSIYIIPQVDANIKWDVIHDGENGKIKNGDVLTLTIANDIDVDAFAKKTGFVITRTSMQYEVECLGEYACDSDIFYYIGNQERNSFNQVINDWVVSSLNDSIVVSPQRTYSLYGYIYYTNGKPRSEYDGYDTTTNSTLDAIEPSDGMLIAIYEITDPYLPDEYYVFIGIEGVFSYDPDGVYINHGELLPNSFVYYEKETVRYNSELGWGQGDDGMGFLYMGLGYAGHQDVQDTYSYLESVYGVKYAHRYVSTHIYTELAERHDAQ
jgi:hypothetical protein